MRKTILTKAESIKELGVINIDNAETNNGRITTFVPIKVINNELDELLDMLCDDFHEKHPEVEKMVTTVNVVYIFGEIDSPRFELEIVIWDENDDMIAEFYEEIPVNLSEQVTKEIKKVIWDALGKSIFNL